MLKLHGYQRVFRLGAGVFAFKSLTLASAPDEGARRNGMAHTVTVDVKHQLGTEEAKRRVQSGIEALQSKLGDKLGHLKIDWAETHADVLLTVMGHDLRGAMDFLPGCVRISLELPWALALIAEKIKGSIAQHTGEMLHLPPPPKA